MRTWITGLLVLAACNGGPETRQDDTGVADDTGAADDSGSDDTGATDDTGDSAETDTDVEIPDTDDSDTDKDPDLTEGDPVDTGSDPVQVDSGSECAQSEECEDDEACFDGTCDFALPRAYRISILSATLASTEPDGDSWDTIGSPDPQVRFGPVDADGDFGDDECRTEVADDTFNATFTTSCDFTLTASTRFAFALLDDDPIGTDEVLVTVFEGASEITDLARSVDSERFWYSYQGSTLVVKVALVAD